MTNQIAHSLPYPGGHIRYAFKMHAAYAQTIPCNIDHPNVTRVVFEKVEPVDPLEDEWHMTIHLGAITSIEEVKQIGNAISDAIIDIVALVLNIKISAVRVIGFGLTPRAGEGGIGHLLLPPLQASGTGSSGGHPLSGTDIQKIQDALVRMSSVKNKLTMKLFRNAVSADEPLVQFLVLYLILDIMHGSQKAIDRFIMTVNPTTPQTVSQDPDKKKKGIQETIYTRLRNEIAHRESFGLDTTIAGISNYLDEFRRIVNLAVSGYI